MGDQDQPRQGLRRELVELILEVVEAESFDALEGHTIIDSAESIDDLWMMEGTAERLAAASREMLAEVRRRMASDIGEFGPVRLGDTLYQVGQKGTRRVIEGQEKMLLEWLGDDLKAAVPASAVRITAVRAVAEKRELTPETIEDTFYWWDADPDEPYALKRIPEIKAPKYFATMAHGDRR